VGRSVLASTDPAHSSLPLLHRRRCSGVVLAYVDGFFVKKVEKGGGCELAGDVSAAGLAFVRPVSRRRCIELRGC